MALLMDLDELALRLGIGGGSFISGTEENKYEAWLLGTDRAVREHVKWNIELVNNDVRIYDGNFQQDLVLTTPFVVDYMPPVTPTNVAFTATTITRATGSWISSGFLLGGYVVVTSAENAGNNGTFGPITILTETVITIESAAFTVNPDDDSATFSPDLLKVWVNNQANGDPELFTSTYQLTPYTMFRLRPDKNYFGNRAMRLSKSGCLQATGMMGALPFVWPSSQIFNRGGISGLAWQKGPFWPRGVGNIKVECTYGFPSNHIPDDIKLAITEAVSIIRNTTKFGFPVSSESLGDYSYSAAIGQMAEFGGVRRLLAPYRDTQF